MLDKITKIINTQLDRANDFKYFALLGAFVFFLDYMLILRTNTPVLKLEYEMLSKEISIGEILLYFCLFTFFLSFLVPFTRYLIKCGVGLIIPYKWLYFIFGDPWKDIDPNDYFYDFQLQEYAIKNDNSVAYQHYKSLLSSQSNEQKLYHFSIAFLLATIFDLYAYFINNDALIAGFIILFSESIDRHINNFSNRLSYNKI